MELEAHIERAKRGGMHLHGQGQDVPSPLKGPRERREQGLMDATIHRRHVQCEPARINASDRDTCGIRYSGMVLGKRQQARRVAFFHLANKWFVSYHR